MAVRTPIRLVFSCVLLCAAAPPCEGAMPASVPFEPTLPDGWWLALVEACDAAVARLRGTPWQAAAWALPITTLAWRCRPAALRVRAAAAGAPAPTPAVPDVARTPAAAADSARAPGPHLLTMIGGFPASGVTGGVARRLPRDAALARRVLDQGGVGHPP